MQVERIPTLSDNYTYLVIDPASREAAVIDAPEAAPVRARVERLGVRPVAVLSTHHHPDHSGANTELAKHYGIPVFGHASDRGRLPGQTELLEDGDRVRVGALEAQVLFIPAHTMGHIAYHFPGAVFCGDTLFAAGCGRLFEGTPQLLHEALNRRLAALPDTTLVYCGHEYTEANLRFALSVEPGNAAAVERAREVRARRAAACPDWHDAGPDEMTIPSTIGLEKATNPFMRVDSPEIRAHLTADDPILGSDPVALLGRLRSLKDRFRG
jgi:hydroxyacylglutathione hydrolase